MILSEQKYTNLNRLYYRGLSKDGGRGYRETYFTTDFLYALAYAGLEGEILVCHLKQTADIFNARSAADLGKLRNFVRQQNEYGVYTKYLEKLKDEDWLELMGVSGRKGLLGALRFLGYDGYFNFEIGKEQKEIARTYCFARFQNRQNTKNDKSGGYSSVGFFIPDSCLVIGRRLRYDDFCRRDDFQNLKKYEANAILEGAPGLPLEDKAAYYKEHTLTLTGQEIEQLLEKALAKENVKLQEDRAEHRRLIWRYRCGEISRERLMRFEEKTRIAERQLKRESIEDVLLELGK